MEMYTQILIKIFFIGVTALIIKLFFDISLMWAIIFVFIINFILLAGKNIILWKESLRRFFDNKGNVTKDIDFTNHGNPKNHPDVPHEHFWDWKDGNPIRKN